MLFGHALPRARITVLEGEPLGIGSVAQEHRIAAVLDRPKHVGTEHQAVVRLDRHVPLDAHAVADFAAVLVGAAHSLRAVLGARILDRGHSDPPVYALILPPPTAPILRGAGMI
jgi:hypothetical protein